MVHFEDGFTLPHQVYNLSEATLEALKHWFRSAGHISDMSALKYYSVVR